MLFLLAAESMPSSPLNEAYSTSYSNGELPQFTHSKICKGVKAPVSSINANRMQRQFMGHRVLGHDQIRALWCERPTFKIQPHLLALADLKQYRQRMLAALIPEMKAHSAMCNVYTTHLAPMKPV